MKAKNRKHKKIKKFLLLFLCIAFVVSFFNFFWTSIPKPVPKEQITILGSALHNRNKKVDYKNDAYARQYERTVFIYDTVTQKSADIFADGYYDLFSPYVISDNEFICSATRTTDDKPFLLFYKHNSLTKAVSVDYYPDQIVYAKGFVYFASDKTLYKMSVADGTTVVLKNNIKPYFKSLNVGRSVFTDGNCILYSSDNEERCSWFMYDCSTGTETFVMEAATCAGFTEDGRVLFGCKKQSEFSEKMIYKEFDLKTNKTNLFMPWIRFLSPNVFNDTYIQNTHDTGYGSVICEPHLVSLKTSCAYYLPNIDVSSVDGIWLTVLEIFSYA